MSDDTYIKEAASLMEQAKGAISAGADKISGLSSDPEIQKLLPYLLAGGAGALGGGFLSGRRKTRSGETRGQYLTRILRNAVLAGGLAGGGSYLAHQGFKKTLGSVDLENPVTGREGDQGPVGAGLRNILFHPLTAATSGLAVLGGTAGMKGIGANPNAASHADSVLSNLKLRLGGKLPAGITDKKSLEALAIADPAAFKQLMAGNIPAGMGDSSAFVGNKIPGGVADHSILGTPADGKYIKHHASAAGINVHDPKATYELPKLLQKLLRRQSVTDPRHAVHKAMDYPSRLIGRSAARRIGRGGLGIAAALIPAVAGAITTDEPS